MFKKVLVANRGEIAVRITRACQELGISTVAVHSEADRDSMHVRIANESVCIGPNQVNKSYLNTHALIAACEITNAEAIHPGYGFLSENAGFAKMVSDNGLTFIGPKYEHIEKMGDKIQAKKIMKELGVPTVPGSEDKINDIKDALKIIDEIVDEPIGGAHREVLKTCSILKETLLSNLKILNKINLSELRISRSKRYLDYVI